MSLEKQMSCQRRDVHNELSLLTLLLAMAVMSFGLPQATLAAPSPAKVYVVEFSPTDRPSVGLSEFARRFFQLRLHAVPRLEVAEDSEIPPCGQGASESVRLSTQASAPATPSSVPVFYRVQGTVAYDTTSGEAESNIVFTYELARSRNCQNTFLLHRTKTFGLADALQNVQDAADEVTSQLNVDIAEKVAVKVGTIEVLGDPKGNYRASDLLTRFIRERIADSEVLSLWDDTSQERPAYTLRGVIQFSQSGKSKVTTKVEFRVNGEHLPVLLPVRPAEPTVDALVPTYLDTSKAVVKGLSDLVYKERAGLNQLSSGGVDALIQRAKQLLCLESAAEGRGCTPDPQAALVALNEAEPRTEAANRAVVMTLVGQAQFQLQAYLAAGEAYEAALSDESGHSDTRLSLLKSAADAWYEAKEYRRAADRYRQCIEEANDQSLPIEKRLQSEARVRVVRSLLLAGQTEAALDASLDGLKAAHNWPHPDDVTRALYRSLSGELERVLGSLPSEKLESVANKLASELAFDSELEASALKQVARAIAREGKHKQAIDEYREVLALKPDDADAHYQLGKELDSHGEYREAIAEHREAIKLKRDDYSVHNDLGVAYSHNHQYPEAIAEFQIAIDQKSDYALAYNNLANTLLLGNQSDKELTEHRSEAEKLYRHAIQVRPSDTRAYYNLWLLYRSLSNSDAAREVFSAVQKVAPDDPRAQLMLATVREDNQDFAGAAEIYSKLHEQYPEESYYVVAWAEAEISGGMNKHDQKLIQTGMRRLEEELSRNPSFHPYFSLAWAYQVVPEVRNLDKAEELYRRALSYRPDHITTMNNLAVIAVEKGELQIAIREWNDILKINPHDLDSLEGVGYALFLTGNLHKAIETYERVLDIAPDDACGHVLYGEATFWLGDTSTAQKQFDRAFDLLSRPEIQPSTWVWLIDPSYKPDEQRRLVYYSTVRQKRALVEFLQGLSYLREASVAPALERYGGATQKLSITNADDKEAARKAINDLNRLEQQSMTQPAVNLGLGFLYEWLAETGKAARYWRLYLESGTDPVGLKTARERLAGNVR